MLESVDAAHDCNQGPASDVSRVSRRDFFSSARATASSSIGSVAKAAAFVASLCAAGAATSSASAAVPRSTSVDVDKNSLLAKLVRRMTFGFTQAEYALATQLGYDGYIEYHLNPAAIDDSAMDSRLSPYTTLGMPPYLLYSLTAVQVTGELSEAWILRASYSKRQFFERMVEFWTDHFNIDIDVDLCFYLKTPDDRNVIRANALGNFPAMLRASVQSPCMLQYLNNNTNLAAAPNENYARELMELHTLSAAGPYTQQDVVQVARCFTGWTFAMRSSDPGSGLFMFENVYHDNGAKTVLGHQIPANGGVQDGLMVADILSSHPSTANFIATKLCKRFLGEDVRQSVIDLVAAAYMSTNGDIKSMVRVMFRPEHLATDYGPRYKRPQHLFVSAFRTLPVTITSTQLLRISYLNGAGHIPYNWGPPDGYPDRFDHWQGLILPRWNFAALLVTESIPGLSFDVNGYFAGLTTAQQMVDKIDQTMFGGEMLANERAQLLAFISINPADVARRRDLVGLAISAPSFQWY